MIRLICDTHDTADRGGGRDDPRNIAVCSLCNRHIDEQVSGEGVCGGTWMAPLCATRTATLSLVLTIDPADQRCLSQFSEVSVTKPATHGYDILTHRLFFPLLSPLPFHDRSKESPLSVAKHEHSVPLRCTRTHCRRSCKKRSHTHTHACYCCSYRGLLGRHRTRQNVDRTATRQGKTCQGKKEQDCIRQGKARHDTTRQDKTRQDKSRQD